MKVSDRDVIKIFFPLCFVEKWIWLAFAGFFVQVIARDVVIRRVVQMSSDVEQGVHRENGVCPRHRDYVLKMRTIRSKPCAKMHEKCAARPQYPQAFRKHLFGAAQMLDGVDGIDHIDAVIRQRDIAWRCLDKLEFIAVFLTGDLQGFRVEIGPEPLKNLVGRNKV